MILVLLAASRQAFAAPDAFPAPSQSDSVQEVPQPQDTALAVDTTRQALADSAVHLVPGATRTVLVKGRRRTRASAGQARSELEGSALLARMGGDLGEVVAGLPGVTLLRTSGVTKPVVAGLHSQRLAIVQEGIRVEGQSWGAEHAPEVDPFQSERLSVVLGGSAVRFGPGAMGGALVAEPPGLPASPGWDGKAQVTGASNGPVAGAAFLLRGTPSWSPGIGIRLQASRRHGGDLSTPRTVLPGTALDETGLSGALGWSRKAWSIEAGRSVFLSDRSLLASAHIGNLTDLQTALEKGEPPDTARWSWDVRRPRQSVEHTLDHARLRAPLPSGWNLELLGGIQSDRRKEWDLHKPIDARLAALDAPSLDYELRTRSLEAVASGGIGATRLQLGGSASFQENEYAGRAFVPNFRNQGVGGFVSASRRSGPFLADGGVRLDVARLETWRRVNGQVVSWDDSWAAISASAGAQWGEGETFLRGGVGTGWRPPSAVELFADGLHHGTASIETGDSTLDAEHSLTAQLSGQLRHGILRLDGQAWATRVFGFIGLWPEASPRLTVRGAFPAFRYRSTRADLLGLDLGARFRVHRSVETSVRGTWQRLDDSQGNSLPFSPAPGLSLGVDGILENADLGEILRAGPELAVHGKARPVPGDYAPQPEAAVLLNARLQWTPQGERGRWSLVLSGSNLTDRAWKDPTDRLRYFASSPGRSLAMKAQWRIS